MNKKTAIVLTGGGARGAYQVGCTRAIYEIVKKDQNLFDVITGNSAGGINATYLAGQARDWGSATQYLVDLWKRLNPDDIFNLHPSAVGEIGLKWISGAIFGGLSKKGAPFNYLLDTTPLKKLLEREVDFKEIHQLIQDKKLSAVALSTTNYFSGSSVVFFDGHEKIQEWSRTDRFSIRTKLNVEHVLGSSAIPFFFPPVQINDSFYGDGCIRQTTPLSPAIHLGAEKLLVIGIRHPHPQSIMRELALKPNGNPKIGQIAGVMMNAIFLDSMESDVERLEKMNLMLKTMENKHHWREIPFLMLRPSRDLGAMTEKLNRELPRTLRYLLRTIGVTGQEGLDLLSYLAFDSSYTVPLIELGYEDTMSRKEEIERFFDS